MLGLNVFTLNHRLSSRMSTPDLYIVLQQPRANAKRIHSLYVELALFLIPNQSCFIESTCIGQPL